MNPSNPSRKVRRVFERVVDREPADVERILRNECSGDSELRARVETLLAHDRVGSDFLETPLFDDHGAWIGRKIGAYRLRAEIGRGGMSRVFVAERCDGEFHHSVAIKILRASLASRGFADRMRTERQILADLAHPSITRLLDGGSTDEGLPYVVMEYVRGWPLDVYADRENATVRRRIELFLAVADAVHAAHRQLVMHCDIKPTNVLVDTEGRAKLLDFGIARWFDVGRADHQVIRALTPGYASPELLAGESISTASDVYSLGVMLHELLVGQRPIRSSGPTSESSAASTLAAEAELPIAERRQTTPKRLSRVLAGDIDAILCRCLEADPDQRYASVEHLTDDLRRWLAGRRVAARSERFPDTVRRFSRRQPMAAAAVVILALVGSSLVVSNIVRGSRLAAERDQARIETQRASQVTAAMLELVQLAAPDRARGTTVLTREVLDRASREVEHLEGDGSKTQLLSRIGALYRELGELSEAERLLRRAITLGRLAGSSERLAEDLAELARVLRDEGRFEEAAKAVAEAMALGSFEDVLGQAERSILRAQIAVRVGDLEQASHDSREALEVVRAGGDHRQLVDALLTRAFVLYEHTHYQQGRELAGEAETVARQSFGERHSSTAAAIHALAALEQRMGNYSAARKLSKRSEELHRELFGAEHPLVAEVLMVRGQIEDQSGDYAAALAAFEESADIRRRRLGAEHPLVAIAMNDAAVVHYRVGRYSEAAAMFSQALEIRRRSLAAGHPDIGQAINSLAGTRQALGDFAEARVLYLEALAIGLEARGPEHADIGTYHHNLAWMERNLERPQAAEEHYRKALEIWIGGVGSDHPLVAMARHNLGWMLAGDPGRRAEAETLLRQALSGRLRALGKNHPSVADSRVVLADLLRQANRASAGMTTFGSALEVYRQALPEHHWKIAMATSVRGALVAAQGDRELAESLLRHGHRELVDILGGEAVATREAAQRVREALG